MKSTNGSHGIEQNQITRDMLLTYNNEIINEIRSRLKGSRFTATQSDPIKIRYMQTLIMGLRCANEILKDVELSEIKEELEELRETLQQTGPGAHRTGFPIRGIN